MIMDDKRKFALISEEEIKEYERSWGDEEDA